MNIISQDTEEKKSHSNTSTCNYFESLPLMSHQLKQTQVRGHLLHNNKLFLNSFFKQSIRKKSV